jgi:hypothetical protein
MLQALTYDIRIVCFFSLFFLFFSLSGFIADDAFLTGGDCAEITCVASNNTSDDFMFHNKAS